MNQVSFFLTVAVFLSALSSTFGQATKIEVTLNNGVKHSITFTRAEGKSSAFDEFYCVDGTLYKGVSVTSISDDTLGILHEDGTGKIPWSEIPKEIYPILQYNPEEVTKRKEGKIEEANQLKAAEAARIAELYTPKDDKTAKKEFDDFKYNGIKPGITTWKIIVTDVDMSEHSRNFMTGKGSNTKVLGKLFGTSSCEVYLDTTFGKAPDSESSVKAGQVIAITGEPYYVEDKGFIRFSIQRIKGIGYISE